MMTVNLDSRRLNLRARCRTSLPKRWCEKGVRSGGTSGKPLSAKRAKLGGI